jgi:hypothetical protein
MRWAREDPKIAMAKVRSRSPSAIEFYFDKVDPDGQLDPDERRRRATSMRNAYMTELAINSRKARRKSG